MHIPGRFVTSFAPVAIALAMLGGLASARPITDEELEQRRAAFEAKIAELERQGQELTDQHYARLLDETIADLEATDFTVDQIERYAEPFSKSGKRDAIISHLDAKAAQEGIDGARAAVLAARMTPASAPPAQVRPRLDRALNHPSLNSALSEGEATEIYYALSRYGHATVAAQMALDDSSPFVGLIPSESPSWEAFVRSLALFEICGELEGESAPRVRETIRTKLLRAAQAGLRRAQSEGNERSAGTFETAINTLEGPFARGELVGQAQPKIDVRWSSDEAFTSFDELRGRVVVLDFWATWCGPCIASFPKMRDEVAHFNGYPVSFIGVTSLQGRHYGPGGKRVDTKDNPELEFELMREYMTQRKITWDVVFTKQDVFNPDFGVGITGIPFVAIIDPTGIVRKAGLSPAADAEEIHDTIVALLNEAGLPSPGDEG